MAALVEMLVGLVHVSELLEDRLGLLTAPDRLRDVLRQVPRRINDFLGQAVAVARARFGGKLSYASLPFDGVDWTPFDFISTDAGYRSLRTPPASGTTSAPSSRRARPAGKPVAITEFGCCTYRGAADQGGRGDRILKWDAHAVATASAGGGKPVPKIVWMTRRSEDAVRRLLGRFSARGVGWDPTSITMWSGGRGHRPLAV